MDSLYLFPPDDNTPMKTCTGLCGRTLPATPEYWHRNGNGGLRNQCKNCCNQRTRNYRSRPDVQERDKSYRSRPDVQVRKKDWRKNYNSRPEIQEYHKTKWKEYYGRPEIQEYRKKHNKEYYRRPETQAHKKAYHKARHGRPDVQERDKAYHKAYYSRPEIQERYRVYNRTRRSRKRSVTGTHTTEQIQDQLKRQKYKCYYCHKKFQKVKGRCVYHIEHTFPLSRVAGTDIPANSIDYLVLSCPTCNLAKGDKFPWEFPEGGRLL